MARLVTVDILPDHAGDVEQNGIALRIRSPLTRREKRVEPPEESKVFFQFCARFRKNPAASACPVAFAKTEAHLSPLQLHGFRISLLRT